MGKGGRWEEEGAALCRPLLARPRARSAGRAPRRREQGRGALWREPEPGSSRAQGRRSGGRSSRATPPCRAMATRPKLGDRSPRGREGEGEGERREEEGCAGGAMGPRRELEGGSHEQGRGEEAVAEDEGEREVAR